jgi:hypothetical protein
MMILSLMSMKILTAGSLETLILAKTRWYIGLIHESMHEIFFSRYDLYLAGRPEYDDYFSKMEDYYEEEKADS